jgi:hypothetical protein
MIERKLFIAAVATLALASVAALVASKPEARPPAHEPNMDEIIAADGHVPGVAEVDRVCYVTHLRGFKDEWRRHNATSAALLSELSRYSDNNHLAEFMDTDAKLKAESFRTEAADEALSNADILCRLRAQGRVTP